MFFLKRRTWFGPTTKLLILGIGAYFLLAGMVRTYNFTVVRSVEREIAVLAPVLVDRVVVVDPGHGGPDPGVVRDDVKEKDITLEVAFRLATFLEQAGSRVILTRKEDRDLAEPPFKGSRKRRDLEKRVAIANENSADVFVSVHVNSFPSSRECGAQTFYHPGSPGGRELALAIQNECKTLLGNTRRKPKEGDYFTGRATKMPSVVVEIGFLTNPREFELLQEPDYQSKVAFAIYAGLVRYFAAQSGVDSPAPVKQ
ncbi:MAG: N-acetylmuramoyl-L-alanine amidase [Bacillota bacterium]